MQHRALGAVPGPMTAPPAPHIAMAEGRAMAERRAMTQHTAMTEPIAMVNPMQRIEAVLHRVLDHLFAEDVAPMLAVQRALGARSVAVFGIDRSGVDRSTTDDRSTGDAAVAAALSSLTAARLAGGARSFGAAVAEPDAGTGTGTIAVELSDGFGHGHPRRFPVLVATGVPMGVVEVGEPLCHLLRAFLRPAGEHAATGDGLGELAVLNELRRWCGSLPVGIERRCFDRFSAALARVHMIFEPVIVLGDGAANIAVRSWEALARLDAGSTTAPQELFTTAERWGSRFSVELDATLADRALRRFAAAHRCSPYRDGRPLPVWINVSLRALWSRSYQRRLAESLRSSGLDAADVTLELSEKEPLGVPFPLEADDVVPSSSPAAGVPRGDLEIDAFRKRLARLRRELGVSFAIDDLGSGYATFERMTQLGDVGVKISRTVLHQQSPLATIDSVLRLAASRRAQHTVIVEGVDDVCPVSLHSLYRIGVRNIQGHVAGIGGEDLRTLGEPTRRRLAELLVAAA